MDLKKVFLAFSIIIIISGILLVFYLGSNLDYSVMKKAGRRVFQETISGPLSNVNMDVLRETIKNVGENIPFSQKTPPLMVLFTTFKNTSDRDLIQSNTVRNWALFKPYIKPICFISSQSGPVYDLAKDLGWDVYPPPRVSEFGTPFLKDMFLKVADIAQKENSTFYGFANGDILFNDGLVNTLMGVAKNLRSLGKTLVVGRRMNFLVVNRTDPLYSKENVTFFSKKGTLFTLDAEDYFFINNKEYIWDNFHNDLVVGRPGWDNYMVGLALMNNLSVVDATGTLMALHQSGREKYAGARNKDGQYNKKKIGKFNYNSGLTSSGQFATQTDFAGNVFIQSRSRRKRS